MQPHAAEQGLLRRWLCGRWGAVGVGHWDRFKGLLHRKHQRAMSPTRQMWLAVVTFADL